MKKIGFLSNKQGFLLLESIIGLLIFSMIFGVILNQLSILTKADRILKTKYNNNMNKNYSRNYIQDEILRADKIIKTDEVIGFNSKFQENIGIIGINYLSNSDNYNYFSYYKYGNEIRRVACHAPSWQKVTANNFKGVNSILKGVKYLNLKEQKNGNLIVEILLVNDEKMFINLEIGNKKKDF